MNGIASIAKIRERDFQVYQTLFLESRTRVNRFSDALE
jgi:hypothetical protein